MTPRPLLSLCALAGAWVSSPAVAGDGCPETLFFTANYPTGYQPEVVAVGDVDGNGTLDLALTDDVEVRLYLGVGNGQLNEAPPVSVGDDPHDVLLVDLNGDGRLDLVVTNSGSDDLSIALGLGDGAFAPETRISVGEEPRKVRTGDLDGDGTPDLVVNNMESDDLSILLGAGDGIFVAAADVLDVGEEPADVALGDWDRDGRLDLAVVNHGTHDITLHAGNGDGTFAPSTAQFAEPGNPLSGLPWEIVAARIDGDEHLDLVVTTLHNVVFLLLGNGDGSFTAEAQIEGVVRPSGGVAADVVGDASTDLVFGDTTRDQIVILEGFGDGSFAEPVTYDTGDRPLFLAVADLDGSGRDDLVTTLLHDRRVSILLHREEDAFGPRTFSFADDVGNADAIEAGDFDGDGVLDLIVASSFPDQVNLYLGLGGAEYAGAIVTELPGRPRDLVTGDFDGNGHRDLALAVEPNGAAVLLGNGDGTFESQPKLISGAGARSITVGEFNGDGHQDLAVVNNTSEDFSVFLGRGDGSFEEREVYPNFPNPTRIAAGDLTGDGVEDLAVIGGSGIFSIYIVRIHEGLGDGTFAEHSVLDVEPTPRDLALADFDRDGRLDILVGSSSHGEDVALLRGLGDGAFAPPTTFFSGTSGSLARVAAADMNADGLLDVVVSFLGLVFVHHGRGDGSFGPPAEFRAVELSLGARVIADLDGDGRNDIAVAGDDFDPSYFAVLTNNSAPRAPLCAGPDAISLSEGGRQLFSMDVGEEYAGHGYWLLGNLSGTEAGFELGSVHVPLDPDAYLRLTVFAPRKTALVENVGSLDEQGHSNVAELALRPETDPALIGLVLHHAFLVVDPVTQAIERASNAVPVTLAD